jgi:SHS2 domain-containing protein
VILDAGFEIIDHTADIGLYVWSQDWKNLFEIAAEGMISLLIDPETVERKEKKTFQIEGDDLVELLLIWLREILFQMEKRGMVFVDFEVKGEIFSHNSKENYKVRADLWGEKRDIKRHDICTEIKAITRHGLSLKKEGFRWEANILFDV